MKENSLSGDQRNWLHTLQSMSKRPLRVSRNVEGRPCKWVSIDAAELPVDYRTVLHNEVVFDIDATQWKKVRLYTEIVIDALNKTGIPYIAAYTGGRGVHVHVFFELSGDQKKQCVETDVMPKDLRMWLFHYVIQEAGVSLKLIGPGNPFDTSCVNWNDEGKGHLIRIFGGKKRQHKTLLKEIPEERPKEIAFPGNIALWKIPEKLFQEFIDQFKKSQRKRVDAVKKYYKASQHFTGEYLNLPCVQKILGGLSEGQRNAGARILAIACRLDGASKKDAEKVVLDYAGNCSQENISSGEYLGWVNWICQQEKPFWNCRFCKELELCKEGCTFHEAAFKDVINFLKNPNLIYRIDKILGKRIKKDKKNRMLVFLVCLSAYGSNPLNLFLKGESSIGKTHIAKSVAEYFPEEDVWFIGDMSPKALIHEQGKFENGKVYISLENKILVFLESPRKETLEMLKPILSHDRKEIEYKITDKRLSGQLGTKTAVIQGWPATIFCSTDHRYLEELSTRSMVATPEVTGEKIAEVLEFKGEQYVRPWETRIDEDEVLLKEVLQQLKTATLISTPYGKKLAQKYNGNIHEPRVMRDFDKLMGLIEMSAFLHQFRRVSFHVPADGDDKFCIANEADLLIGMSLFESVRETTVTGLPQSVLDFYEKVVIPLPEVTYRSMMDQYTQCYGRTISQVHLKHKYSDPLLSTGYLLLKDHPVDGRKKIFEKRISEEEIIKKTKEYQIFVLKDIFSEYELKEYLESVEKIVQKNSENKNTNFNRNYVWGERNLWFYVNEKNLHYFLEEDNQINKGIKEKNDSKNKNCLNLGNLEGKKPECEVEENELIDQYDEETVLLQIPQDDTKVTDVVCKFKDQNKVVDTIVVLQEKKQVIAGVMDGQSYIRRLVNSQKKPDVHEPGMNTWTCARCGKKFQARNPYRDENDHAVCEDCWKISCITDSLL